jgi:ssDNA-binding Zn-finger/Zn-ribbon topoisomerase 1
MAICVVCKKDKSAYVRVFDGLKVCPKCYYEISMRGLNRAPEQRNEAEAGEQICPDCGGLGVIVDIEGSEHDCLLCL